jgi:saccharopine dehydrogenase-like NADP-dependent oxidoreductase
VVVYAVAQGAHGGQLRREEFVRTYRPKEIAGETRTAIAWTTAAGAVGTLELLAQGALDSAGFIRQEDVPLAAFLQTSAGRLLADGHTRAVRDEAPLAL